MRDKLNLNKVIVFSDLDGSLLNSRYSFQEAKDVISRLNNLDVPIILCSSKTRKEIEHYRTKLGINAPFISENGAAVFVPKATLKKPKTTTNTSANTILLNWDRV